MTLIFIGINMFLIKQGLAVLQVQVDHCFCPLSMGMGIGCTQLVRASERHSANARSIPRCGEGFFSQSQLSVQTLLRCPYTPVCNRLHFHQCTRWRSPDPCQISVEYGNTKTPSMHPMLGSTTLLQLAFPGEGNPNFPWNKSHWDNTVVKSKKY